MIKTRRHPKPTLFSLLWPWLTAGIVALIGGLITAHWVDQPWSIRAGTAGALVWGIAWGLGILRAGPVGGTAHWLVEDAYAAVWTYVLMGLFWFVVCFAFSLLWAFLDDPAASLEARASGMAVVGVSTLLGIWSWLRG